MLACLLLARPACAQGPADAILFCRRDAARLGPQVAVYTRYLWLAHMPVAERQEMWTVLSGHVNGLSREALIYRPVILLADGSERDGLKFDAGVPQVPPAIAPAEWAKAVCLRVNGLAYDSTGKLFLKVWEKLPSPHFLALLKKEVVIVKPGTQSYGYFVRRSDGQAVTTTWDRSKSDALLRWVETTTVAIETKVKKVAFVTTPAPWLPPKETAALIALTGSQVPVVFGDWFFWQSAIQVDRGVSGYYDFLGIKDEKTFQELIGFDRELFLKKFKQFQIEIRAAVGRSGVANQPRRIARFEKIGGGLWITFDNVLSVNRLVDGKVQFRNPLSVPGNEFQFDATEQFGHLPNGLWAMGLFNAQGVKQDSAPDFIGYDKTTTSNDGRIHAGQCLRCHSDGGLKNIRDWYRNLYRPPIAITSPDYRKLLGLQQLYFRKLEPYLAQDRQRFLLALTEATGYKRSQDHSTAYGNRWRVYGDDGVSAARAARELGVDAKMFDAALKAFLTNPLSGDLVLAMWARPADEQEELGIDQWHEAYPLAQQAVFAHRAIIGAGYKPPNLESEECKKWVRAHKGLNPAYEKDGRFFSWAEATQEARVNLAKWPVQARVGKSGE